MKIKRTFVGGDPRFTFLRLVCVLAVGFAALAESAPAQPGSPIAISGLQFSSGMAGLASGQTARLSVVNVGPSTGSPIPCVLGLAFLDSDSKILNQMFVAVAPGKAAFLDLTMNIRDSDRLQIRGIGYNPLLAAGSAIPQPLSCNLVLTLELFDTVSKRTVAVLTNFKDLTPVWK
jgi:hypothetical protein